MEYFHNTRVIGFNPHTHAGCDIARCHFFIFKKVSIHTPTQGVTPDFPSEEFPVGVSIHTPTQGVTIIKDVYHGIPRFNPHTHAGCDSISNNIL